MLRVILEIVPFPTPQISTFQPAYYLSTALSIAHPNSYTHTLIFTTRPPSSPRYSYQLHTLHYPSAKIVETIRTVAKLECCFDALVSYKLMGRKPLYITAGRGVTDPLTGAGFSVTRTIMSNFPLQCSPPRAQVQLNLLSFHYTDSQDTRNICYKYGLYLNTLTLQTRTL
jgi:hypothetical protein